MIVVDASVVTGVLVSGGEGGRALRLRLRGRRLAAPELIDLEVCSALRRFVHRSDLSVRRAQAAIDELALLPIQRAPHRALLARVWELRANLTAYEAAYVALAELLSVPLLTADGRLAAAPGIRCAVELVSP